MDRRERRGTGVPVLFSASAFLLFIFVFLSTVSLSYSSSSSANAASSLVSFVQSYGDKQAAFSVWKPEIESSAHFLVEQMNRNEKEKGLTYKLEKLETETSAVFDAILYSVDVKLDKMIVPFHFVSLKSPVFSWLSLPSEVPELSSLGALPTLTMSGPMEFYLTSVSCCLAVVQLFLFSPNMSRFVYRAKRSIFEFHTQWMWEISSR